MNSFIPWIGGKKVLSKEILKRFPSETSKRYIEVFGGAGWVMFKKEMHKGQMEVFNDIDNNLISLYRCIKFHPDEVEKELQNIFMSRNVFDDFKMQLECIGLTDIQRSARYLYLIKTSFGANHRSFSTDTRRVDHAISMFTDVQERLKNVIIENRNYDQIIQTYDRVDALFYLDPPYHKTEKYYAQPNTSIFNEKDHAHLASLLHNIKGKFILSYNDDPFIRALYSDFKIEDIERNTTLAANSNSTIYKELIISNF